MTTPRQRMASRQRDDNAGHTTDVAALLPLLNGMLQEQRRTNELLKELNETAAMFVTAWLEYTEPEEGSNDDNAT